MPGPKGALILAHGRDPYFPGWPDTLQLDYGNPATQAAMTHELMRVAERCDSVRCDMAMLVLPDVFERTWGRKTPAFWPTAIGLVRERFPKFGFMAEVYWDLEWTIQQQGFDYAYDKRLYDRLRARDARAVRDHFRAAPDFQNKSARFLENHDEPRAAEVFSPEVHRAAAVLTFLCPGLRFFQQGQFEGRKTRVPVQLCRAPAEPADPDLEAFYGRLLHLAPREGDWSLVECRSAWEGNWTCDCFIAFAWQIPGGRQLLIAVNYAPNQSQCSLPLPPKPLRLRDLLGPAVYDRNAPDLYLDLPPWGYHVFEVTPE
jgi:hypothetical protein